jgi:hypothetical protein
MMMECGIGIKEEWRNFTPHFQNTIIGINEYEQKQNARRAD